MVLREYLIIFLLMWHSLLKKPHEIRFLHNKVTRNLFKLM